MPTLSTHILDTSRGVPAAGVIIEVARNEGDREWNIVATAVTDDDGRARPDLADGLTPGEWCIRFHVGAYLASSADGAFFEEIDVRFLVDDDRHYHVPLLLSPWSYSTYRGS